jgi:hypothetical protein
VELIAAVPVAKIAALLRDILVELVFPIRPTLMYIANKAAINTALLTKKVLPNLRRFLSVSVTQTPLMGSYR